jgi:hypothetical protein
MPARRDGGQATALRSKRIAAEADVDVLLSPAERPSDREYVAWYDMSVTHFVDLSPYTYNDTDWAYPVLTDIQDQGTWGLRKDVQHHGERGKEAIAAAAGVHA